MTACGFSFVSPFFILLIHLCIPSRLELTHFSKQNIIYKDFYN